MKCFSFPFFFSFILITKKKKNKTRMAPRQKISLVEETDHLRSHIHPLQRHMASQKHAPPYDGQVEIGGLRHKLENSLEKEERKNVHVALFQHTNGIG